MKNQDIAKEIYDSKYQVSAQNLVLLGKILKVHPNDLIETEKWDYAFVSGSVIKYKKGDPKPQEPDNRTESQKFDDFLEKEYQAAIADSDEYFRKNPQVAVNSDPEPQKMFWEGLFA